MLATWTPEELKRLRLAYGSSSAGALQRLLPGRSTEEIDEKAAELAIARNKAAFTGRKMPRWTEDEVEELRQLHPTTSNRAIALALGKSAKAVASKAHQLGLKKAPTRLESMGRENVALRRDRLDT